MFKKNEQREKFKEMFKKQINSIDRGSFLEDGQLEALLLQNKIGLRVNDAKVCIRNLEEELGILYRKRLKRVRGEGYLILEPLLQVQSALKEGKTKIERTLKKTGKRLQAVEVNQFTEEQKRELLSRTAAVDSLLTIIENSSINKKIMNRREMELLSNTATSTKAINKLGL